MFWTILMFVFLWFALIMEYYNNNNNIIIIIIIIYYNIDIFTLQKQTRIRGLIYSLSRKMRAFSFGCDRFTRGYWNLPTLGGMYVEGVNAYPNSVHPWKPLNQMGVFANKTTSTEVDPPSNVTPPTTVESSQSDEVGPITEIQSSEMPDLNAINSSSYDSTNQSSSLLSRRVSANLTLSIPQCISSFKDEPNKIGRSAKPLSPTSTSVTITIKSPSGIDTVSGTMEMVPVETVTNDLAQDDEARTSEKDVKPHFKSSGKADNSLEQQEDVRRRSPQVSKDKEKAQSSGGERAEMEQETESIPCGEEDPYKSNLPVDKQSDIWFSIAPRDPCNIPCNLQRLIEKCSTQDEKQMVKKTEKESVKQSKVVTTEEVGTLSSSKVSAAPNAIVLGDQTVALPREEDGKRMFAVCTYLRYLVL